MEGHILPPKPQYKGRNGFLEPVLRELESPQTMPALLGSNGEPSAPKAVRERKMREMVENHRLVEDMLAIKGSYFPGLEAMQDAAKPATSSDLTSLIQEMEARHKQDISKLMDVQTKDHISRVLDTYQSVDGIVELYDLDKFIERQTLSDVSVFSDATSEYNNYRYAHMCTVNALIKRRNELRDKEESERKIRDARFPSSIAQWRATDSPDIQLRVARFLVSDKDTKERMLSQYGWAWRQVEPLEGDFDQNITFQSEIKARVREGEVKDLDPPRKAS